MVGFLFNLFSSSVSDPFYQFWDIVIVALLLNLSSLVSLGLVAYRFLTMTCEYRFNLESFSVSFSTW